MPNYFDQFDPAPADWEIIPPPASPVANKLFEDVREVPFWTYKPQFVAGVEKGSIPGMLETGNIDVVNRPAEEETFTIDVDGKKVLVPSIAAGRVLTKEEAIKNYRQSAEHLGIFEDVDAADAYAQKLRRWNQALVPKNLVSEGPASQVAEDEIPVQGAIEDQESLKKPRRQVGLLTPGNIDFDQRAVVETPEGFKDTERPIMITELDKNAKDYGKTFLIPTIIDGKAFSTSAAVRDFKKTGKHLGVFTSELAALEYADKLRGRQEEFYGMEPLPLPPTTHRADPHPPPNSLAPAAPGNYFDQFDEAREVPPPPLEGGGAPSPHQAAPSASPVTFYSYGASVGGPDESEDEWTNKGYTKTGNNLVEGVVAVNPQTYPLGTLLRDEASGQVLLAADEHRNPDPRAIDVFTEPEHYRREKTERQLTPIGQVDEIPKTKEGMQELLSSLSTPATRQDIAAANRERLSSAIAKAEQQGYTVPHFIGTPGEPEGDRAPTMDMENLAAALKKQEEEALRVGNRKEAAKIGNERGYWEDKIKTEGMTAEQWKRQTGEEDPRYPHEPALQPGRGLPVQDAVDPDAPYMSKPRDMAKVSRIIVHGDVNEDADALLDYGRKVDPARGFAPGYHFYIGRDGAIKQGAPVDRITNHTLDNNSDSIGIVLAGADEGKMPTAEQEAAAKALISDLGPRLGIDPSQVVGHGELQPNRRDVREGGTVAQQIREQGYTTTAPVHMAEEPYGVPKARGVPGAAQHPSLAEAEEAERQERSRPKQWFRPPGLPEPETGEKNFFDQFDEPATPEVQAPPTGPQAAAPAPPGEAAPPAPPAAPQAPPAAPSQAPPSAPAAKAGGNYFDQFDELSATAAAPAPAGQNDWLDAWNSFARGASSEGLLAALEGGYAAVEANLPRWGVFEGVRGNAREQRDQVTAMRERVRNRLSVDRDFEEAKVGQVLQGFGQLVSNLPAYVVPGAGPLMSASQLYDEARQDYIQTRKAQGKKVDDAEANRAAIQYLMAAGPLDYALDKMIVGKFLKAARKAGWSVGDVLKAGAATAATGGLSEAGQQAWLNATAILQRWDPDRPITKEVWDSLVVGGFVGAGGGAVATAAGQAAGVLEERRQGKAEDQLGRARVSEEDLTEEERAAFTDAAKERPGAAPPVETPAPAQPPAEPEGEERPGVPPAEPPEAAPPPTEPEGEERFAPPGIKMAKAAQPAKVPVHVFDRKAKDFTTAPMEPTPELLSDLKDQESLYSRLIDCLTK